MNLPTPDPAFHWTAEAWGSGLRCAPLDAIAQHVFTSKQLKLLNHPGPPGMEMTPTLGSGWLAATASVGSSVDRLMRVKQVHGHVVRVLRRGDVAEGAALDRPDGDAVVANEPGLVLAVMVADCVPILLADRTSGAAAAIHAGWRGTCARVAPTAVERMAGEFGTRPENLIAAIGPSIGPSDYEVGATVLDAFLQAGHARRDMDRWLNSDGTLHLDLGAANRDQLAAVGVRPDQIFMCGLSTLAHREVFDSYRAEGERAGRMAALIVVPACS